MPSRTFELRLHGTHEGPGLSSPALSLERRSEEGNWQAQTPELTTPPFRLHLIALLLCLRFHLLAEARERQIPLSEMRATLRVTVSGSWDLETVVARFQLWLPPDTSATGRARASAEAIQAMQERMRLSPVARNLPPAVPLTIGVEIETEMETEIEREVAQSP